MFKIKLARPGSRPAGSNDGPSPKTKSKSHNKQTNTMTHSNIKQISKSPDRFIEADNHFNIHAIIRETVMDFTATNRPTTQSSNAMSKSMKNKPTIREPLKVKLPKMKRPHIQSSKNNESTDVRCNTSEIRIHKIKLPSLSKKHRSSSLLISPPKFSNHSSSSMTTAYQNSDDLKMQTSDDTNSQESDTESSQFNIKVETVNRSENVEELDTSFNLDKSISSSSDGYRTSSANTSLSSDEGHHRGMQIVVTKSETSSGSEIRCACGVNDDLGVMVECEKCSTWQHGHCINVGIEDDAYEGYVCAYCSLPKDNVRKSLCGLTVGDRFDEKFSTIETFMNESDRTSELELTQIVSNNGLEVPILNIDEVLQSIQDLRRVKNSLEVKWNLLTSQAYEQELRIWQNPIWSEQLRENSTKHKNLYFLDRCKGNLELNIRNMIKQTNRRCNLINFLLDNAILWISEKTDVSGQEIKLAQAKQSLDRIALSIDDLKSKLKNFSS